MPKLQVASHDPDRYCHYDRPVVAIIGCLSLVCLRVAEFLIADFPLRQYFQDPSPTLGWEKVWDRGSNENNLSRASSLRGM